METIDENRNLSEDKKLHRLKIAKGRIWYDCQKSPRMIAKDFGFECPNCDNLIGFNLTRLQESPLNVKQS